MTKMNYFPLPVEAAKIPLDDYTGIIAFSGGVESVALMSWLSKTDEKVVAFNFSIALADPPYGPIEVWLAKQRVNAQEICKKFDIPLMEVDLQMTNMATLTNQAPEYRYSFQRWYISFFLGMVSVYNPGIKNLYYGLNNEDTSAVNPETRATMESFIGMINSESKLQTPLLHMTKSQQWELIPDDVKPLVLTCFNKVCGTCFKCEERIKAGIPLQ